MALSECLRQSIVALNEWHAETLGRMSRTACLPWEQYYALPERQDALRVARRNVENFEECRLRFLKRLDKKEGMQLDYNQAKWLDEMRNTALLRMYRGRIKDLMGDRAWLRDQFRVVDLYSVLMVTLPRRRGKTMMETIYSLVTSLSQPGGNILCANPYVAQGGEWMKLFYENLELMKNDERFGYSISSHQSGETIEIISHFTGEKVRRPYRYLTSRRFTSKRAVVAQTRRL